jgi:hypothetical protein
MSHACSLVPERQEVSGISAVNPAKDAVAPGCEYGVALFLAVPVLVATGFQKPASAADVNVTIEYQEARPNPMRVVQPGTA